MKAAETNSISSYTNFGGAKLKKKRNVDEKLAKKKLKSYGTKQLKNTMYGECLNQFVE